MDLGMMEVWYPVVRNERVEADIGCCRIKQYQECVTHGSGEVICWIGDSTWAAHIPVDEIFDHDPTTQERKEVLCRYYKNKIQDNKDLSEAAIRDLVSEQKATLERITGYQVEINRMEEKLSILEGKE